jgi:hypothetical protein
VPGHFGQLTKVVCGFNPGLLKTRVVPWKLFRKKHQYLKEDAEASSRAALFFSEYRINTKNLGVCIAMLRLSFS